jgi:hypothetical protein
MKTKRKPPTMAEKLASALLEVQRLRGDPIPREHAKLMHAEQICSLYQFDHDAGFACHGVDNHPTMLTPKLRPEHKEKTAKIDQPAIAKCDRREKAQEEFRAIVLAKSGQGEAPARKSSGWGSRKFNTKGAKLQSRNNLRKKALA